MTPAETTHTEEPIVVHTHVTPWGFVVALPLAVAFAVLGAHLFDAPGLLRQPGPLAKTSPWLFGVLLIAFALFLFQIGVAELAAYCKPSVEVVVDEVGITTYGALGARRVRWDDVLWLDVDQRNLTLHARGRTRGGVRNVRLHFSRLAIDPARLMGRIAARRPDLAPGRDDA